MKKNTGVAIAAAAAAGLVLVAIAAAVVVSNLWRIASGVQSPRRPDATIATPPDPALGGLFSQLGRSKDGRPEATARFDDRSLYLEFTTFTGQRLSAAFAVRACDPSRRPPRLDLELTAADDGFWSEQIGSAMVASYEVEGDHLRMATFGPGVDRRPRRVTDGRRAITWLMRRSEGAEQPAEPAVASTGEVDPRLIGHWAAFDNMRMWFFEDGIVAYREDRPEFLIEWDILGWDTRSGRKRIEAVVINHPWSQRIGERDRMIYETAPGGILRIAGYDSQSPRRGRWPDDLTGRSGEGLTVTEWQRVEPEP